MTTLNLKSVASAVGALALTMLLSWSVTDASNYVSVKRDANSGLVAAISALVR
jgi:hypothetical protein